MIRALTFLFLTACTAFPQLETKLSKDIGPRPALLTVSELHALLKDSAASDTALSQSENGLRERADALRSR